MLYVLSGENIFSIDQRIEELKDLYVKTVPNIEIDNLDETAISIEEIFAVIDNFSLFSSQKLIVIKNPEKIKQFEDKVESLINDLGENILILAISKIDKRTSLYKFLKSQKNFEEFNMLSGVNLSKWLQNYAKSIKVQINPSEVELLVSRLGNNQYLLKNELDKLSLIGSVIDRKLILDFSDQSIENTIFDLIEAAFNGNPKRAIDIYERQRELKVEPIQIMYLISWQLMTLSFVYLGKNLSPMEMQQKYKIKPYAVSKAKRITDKISYSEFKLFVSKLSEIDYKSKTSSIDLDEALKNYLVSIS